MTLTRHIRPASLALTVVALISAAGAGIAYADDNSRDRGERRAERRESRQDSVRDRREIRREGRVDRRDFRQDGRENRRDFRQDRGEYRRDFRQDRREVRRDVRQDRRENVRDVRDVRRRDHRVYPYRGTVIRSLPREHRVIHHHRRPYYYSHGAWYRPSGGRFVVIAPPLGIVVPFLPYGYVTMHVGRSAYYVANDVYYVRRPNGYVVVEPPEGARRASDDGYVASQEQIYIYPRKGQSAQQQSKDRYECHAWARDETGFDPTRQFADLSDEEIDDMRSDYHRAMGACLDARGYTVR